jgi:SulP family sulfate permease
LVLPSLVFGLLASSRHLVVAGSEPGGAGSAYSAAITMVTVGEGLLLARSYADKYGYATSPNRDLLAFGGANLASGLSSGFTIGSATSRAAAMDQAGSRTQVPMLVTAAGALLILRFGADLLAGIVLAFVLSLINLLRKAARPAVDILQGCDDPRVSLTVSDGAAETVPGVIAMRFAAPIFFGNAQTLSAAVRRAVQDAPHPLKAFILDMEGVTDVDVTGAELLARELQWLQGNGITFAYSRVRPQLRANLDRMQLLAGHLVFDTNRAAVAALRPPPDPD